MYSHTFLTSIDKFNLEQKRSFNFTFLIFKTEFLFFKMYVFTIKSVEEDAEIPLLAFWFETRVFLMIL